MPQHVVGADIRLEALAFGAKASERFVYSRRFVPLKLTHEDRPLLPSYAVLNLSRYGRVLGLKRLKELLRDIGGLPKLPELIDVPVRLPPIPGPQPDPMPQTMHRWDDVRINLTAAEALVSDIREHPEHVGESSFNGLHARLVEAADDLRHVASTRLDEQGEDLRPLADELAERLEYAGRLARPARDIPPSPETLAHVHEVVRVVRANASELVTAVSSSVELPIQAGRLPLLLKTQLENALRAQTDADLGVLFMDRTRIWPIGFVLGEHLLSLSLAPAEEVSIEQRTFSKREITFEEQTDSEQQFELELSSTLSTDLQEGLTHQTGTTDKRDFSVGGRLTGGKEGAGSVSIDGRKTDSVTEADTTTRQDAVKESVSASRKVAARYRTAHKTVFRVSTEQRFELTSRRVLRNPNRYTAIDLLYFKLLQRLKLRQERYGVRLAWAPCIQDPGAKLFERLEAGRKRIFDAAVPAPTMPPAEPPKPADREPTVRNHPGFEAKGYNLLCGKKDDYTLSIATPPGYRWDGDVGAVNGSLNVAYSDDDLKVRADVYVNNDARLENGEVKLGVHVGVSEKDATALIATGLGGPGAGITATLFGGGTGGLLEGCGKIEIRFAARFIPEPTQAEVQYKKDYKDWQDLYANWQAAEDEAKRLAQKKAIPEADAWAAQALADSNPLAEILHGIIDRLFPMPARDECWEIELWRSLFEWEYADYTLFPSWWSNATIRDPSRDPGDFLNASWARIYLPVRIGRERQALRWILARTTADRADDATEAAIARIVREIEGYREQHFGGKREISIAEPRRGGGSVGDALARGANACPPATEKVICLGEWEELLPTDGTHLEVVQASTDAADEHTHAALKRNQIISEADRHNRQASTDLKRKLRDELANSDIDVHVHVDSPRFEDDGEGPT